MPMYSLAAINEKGAEYIKKTGTCPRNLTVDGMAAYNRVLAQHGVQYVRNSETLRMGATEVRKGRDDTQPFLPGLPADIPVTKVET